MKRITKIIIASVLTSTLLPILTMATNGIKEEKTKDAPIGEFTIHPTYKHGDNLAWIVHTANPGSNFTDFVTLENLTDSQQQLSLRIHEAEEKESFIIDESTEYQNLGNWISMPQTTYTLSPHETKKIELNFKIPKNIASKKYVGTILASKSKTNDQNIDIVTRIGVRIYLNINEKNLQTNIFTNTTHYDSLLFTLAIIGFVGAVSLNLMTSNKK